MEKMVIKKKKELKRALFALKLRKSRSSKHDNLQVKRSSRRMDE